MRVRTGARTPLRDLTRGDSLLEIELGAQGSRQTGSPCSLSRPILVRYGSIGGRPRETGDPRLRNFRRSATRRRSQTRALVDLAPRHDVRLALRITHLRRRRVAVTNKITPDPVGDVFVRVRIAHHVVVESHGAQNPVADEAHPERGVARHRHPLTDDAVLDGRELPLATATVHPHAARDAREVDLQRSGSVGVNHAVNHAGAGTPIVSEYEGGTLVDPDPVTDIDLCRGSVAPGPRRHHEPVVSAGGKLPGARS